MKVTLQKSSGMLQVVINGKFVNFQEATRLLTGVEKFSDPYGIFHIDNCVFEYKGITRRFGWRDFWFTDAVEKIKDELIHRALQVREWRKSIDSSTVSFEIEDL